MGGRDTQWHATERRVVNWLNALVPLYRVDRKDEEVHEDVWTDIKMGELEDLLSAEENHWVTALPVTCGDCGGPLDRRLRCGCMSLAGQSNFQLQQEFVRRIGGRVTNTSPHDTPLAWSREY